MNIVPFFILKQLTLRCHNDAVNMNVCHQFLKPCTSNQFEICLKCVQQMIKKYHTNESQSKVTGEKWEEGKQYCIQIALSLSLSYK